MRTWWLATVAALVMSCASAPRYTYRPTGQTPIDPPVPQQQQQPRGDVRVATVGVIKTKLPEGDSFRRTARMLHVHMIVRNDDAEVWTVAADDQSATINGTLRRAPQSAAVDGDDGVRLAVLVPGETRTVDLYYELPPGLHDAAAVSSVRVDWRVTTPAGALVCFRSDAAAESFRVPSTPQQEKARSLTGFGLFFDV